MKNSIGIVLFPIVLLLFSFTFLIFNVTFTDHLLMKYSMNTTAAIPATHQLLDYFQNQAEVPALFNTDEQAHLKDVKHVIWYAIISFFILIILLSYFVMKGDRHMILKRGSITLVVLIIIAAIVPFDFLFSIFHKIFFPQGNYMFPADSILIQFYPEKFFLAYAISIAVLAMFINAILFLAEIVSRRG